MSTRFKPAEGSWECPACMVNNKATDDKCAACTTSRLGSTPAATVGTSSTEVSRIVQVLIGQNIDRSLHCKIYRKNMLI